ncbi:autotransporter outer membrane beta-barrel domain-containing protein [Pseudomonas entomophila]|uniref:autotransporter outer membrane beta-barrel domain-containing protein n=1 Tax=Pseudomonas entomophila TaxID=312306 RepID=UPI00200FAC60|nr:autotransporter outer membrane beta-barrel domain-containing protein [Pseudomonas entomophila]
MHKDHRVRIAFTPGFSSLRFAGLLSLGLLSQPALALVLNNQDLTITAATPLDFYTLNNQSHLTVDGAQTQNILVRQNSLLEILSGTTQANGIAIQLVDSQAQINNGSITSATTFALVLGHSGTGAGSTATVSNSTLQGGTVGVQVNADGRLQVADSRILATNATGIGMRLLSGSAEVTRTQISGQSAGVQLSTELARPFAPQLVLDGSTVTSSAGPGIDVVTRGDANIVLRNGTSITSDSGTAVRVGETANASMTAIDSSMNGDVLVVGAGAATLGLQHSALSGNVVVQDQGTVSLTMSDDSRMVGDARVSDAGAATLGLRQSSLSGNVIAQDQGTVSLTMGDDSRMVGDVGVSGAGSATLSLHQSSLSGNVVAQDQGSVSLTMTEGSRMTGDMTATPGARAQLNMESGSQLEGRLSNVAQANIASDANWTLTGNSNVGDLALNGGRVTFGNDAAFYDLTVTNLSGNGTFVMASDFATGAGDQLIVTGTSEGNHGLLVGSSGQEASVESLRLVQTADGGAQFHLLNDRERVDVGAYSYELAQDGNDWVLNRETRTVAPITMAAMALFNTPITVAYGELSSLRSRMGELRYSEGRNAGVWMRAYGNQYNVSGASLGAGYQQNQRGLSLGADMQLADSDWLLGVLAGSSRSDLNLDHGTSGTVDSYYVGGYATWLDRETGFYVDTVLKYNRYQNNAKVGLSDHTRSKGDYDTHGVSASVEAGKHIKLNDGYFIEPFVQVATAAVAGKDYTFDNGLRAEGDMAKSLLGKVGTTVGKTIPLDGGAMVQPYVKGAFAHEFAQRNQVQVNDNVFNNDLSGSRAELGAGVSLALSKQFRVHADVEYSNGKNIEQPYGVNVGVRYDF